MRQRVAFEILQLAFFSLTTYRLLLINKTCFSSVPQAELDAAKQNSNGVLMFKVANGKVSYITESDQQGAAGGSRPAVNVPPMRPPPSRGGADDGGF